MTGLPGSMIIGFWVAGSCWAVALVAYLFDAVDGMVFALVLFGVITGITEYILRRGQEH